MQQAREERRAFWVTNWKQGNTRELSARVPSPTVNLYTVLGRLIPTEKWHSLPSPSPIPPCSSSHPYRRNSVCALTMRNLTELLTGAVPQLANNFKISDNEGNIKQGLQRKPEYKKTNHKQWQKEWWCCILRRYHRKERSFILWTHLFIYFKKVSQGKESNPSWRRQMLKEHVTHFWEWGLEPNRLRIRYSRLRAGPLSPKWLWSCYFKVKPLHNVVLTAPPFNCRARLMVPQLALRSMSPASATLSAPPYQCGIHPRNTYSHSPTLWVESAVRSEDTTGIG